MMMDEDMIDGDVDTDQIENYVTEEELQLLVQMSDEERDRYLLAVSSPEEVERYLNDPATPPEARRLLAKST